MSCCFVLFHSSSFEILSGQRIAPIMSALSFAVHNDKENVGVSKGINLKSIGSKNKGIHVQPTPRKALIDVNHDSRVSLGVLNSFTKESHLYPLKAHPKVSSGVENIPQGTSIKKIEAKKTPKLQTKVLKNSKENSTSVNVDVKPKKKHTITPQPPASTSDDEEESIFPKSQRLSSYVDKLLTWRPPCLFGTIPDSEPESDNDDALMDKLVNTPVLFPEVALPEFSEQDLDLMIDLLPLDVPEPDIDQDNRVPNTACSSVQFSTKDLDLSIDLQPLEETETDDKVIFDATPNTSLSLGTLQMLCNYDSHQTKD
nr:hypothetical protein BgiMline_001909 [Biomphalaria glabrata]